MKCDLLFFKIFKGKDDKNNLFVFFACDC